MKRVIYIILTALFLGMSYGFIGGVEIGETSEAAGMIGAAASLIPCLVFSVLANREAKKKAASVVEHQDGR